MNHEDCYSVNVNPEFWASLDVLSALPGLSVEVDEGSGRARVLVKIASRVGSCAYVAHTRRGVTTTLSAVLSELERVQRGDNRPLLLSPYLTPAVTKRLLAERVEFVDGAGNVFLDSPAAYVLVLGNKPNRTLRSDGFTVTDLKPIYALLSSPALRRATQRDLSAVTCVSLGKISATLGQMETAGYSYRARSGALLLHDPAQLLGRWEFGYLEQLRPKLVPSGWRLGKDGTLEGLLAHAATVPGVLVGGEVAADEFTRYLKPVTLTLHVPRGKVKSVAAELRLPPADGDADITLLERFTPQAQLEDPYALDRFQGESRRNLAHPILVRAELLAQGDGRLRKVADCILDDVILPKLTGTDA